MKKLLSLVLALVLALSLGSVALAFEWDVVTGTHWIMLDRVNYTYTYSPASEMNPFADIGGLPSKDGWSVRADWEKGGALVDGFKWTEYEGEWYVMMVFNPNYTIEDPKELVGTVELFHRASDTKFTVSISSGGNPLFFVANGVEEVQGAAKAEDADEYNITDVRRNHIIYKCDEDAPGYVKFNSGGASLLQITAKMNRNEKLHLYLVEDDDDVLTALSDLGIDPEAVTHTYTLEGAVPFQNPARHTLQADYAEQYHIYAFDGKNLTEVKAEWNSIEGVYEWWATEMTTYVISDRELKLPDPEADPKTEG